MVKDLDKASWARRYRDLDSNHPDSSGLTGFRLSWVDPDRVQEMPGTRVQAPDIRNQVIRNQEPDWDLVQVPDIRFQESG